MLVEYVRDKHLLYGSSPFGKGVDLPCAERTFLPTGGIILVGTGIKVAIPDGYVGIIFGRSGLACKEKIHVCHGVIDPEYRGEIMIQVINHGNGRFIEEGERIAQLLILPCPDVLPVSVEEFKDTTTRGIMGFGHSGKYSGKREGVELED